MNIEGEDTLFTDNTNERAMSYLSTFNLALPQSDFLFQPPLTFPQF